MSVTVRTYSFRWESHMGNATRKIEDVELQVQQLIQMNSNIEVTADTKHKISGIYMIYINNFSSETVVPIYIGRSVDIQKRYKEHLVEVLALNRLSSEEYHKYFFSKSRSLYERKFKSTKIFKYMIEHKCTLRDFRMVVLEEVAYEFLVEKEQEYFQRFLPSFFGFNQFDSFLKQEELRFSKSEINNLEIKDFLRILLDDVKSISAYYEYGYTRFNFEHALPKGLFLSLKERNLITVETLSDYEEVDFELEKLERLYNIDLERNELKKELEVMDDEIKKLEELKISTFEDGKEAIITLRNQITEKFKELDMYKNKIPINNFVDSILSDEPQKYRTRFLKFLTSYDCDLDFYELYEDEINYIKKVVVALNETKGLHNESCELRRQKAKKNVHKRYQLIYPQCSFGAFSLGDMSKNLTFKINDEYELLNTCHINIYISNDGISRSEIRKEPHIIRIDYCYIDTIGNRTDKSYYIDNETTRNCQTGLTYFEKDYYDSFVFKKVPFKLTSLIDDEIDNSFISINAEIKHGMNDCTLKDKSLVQLSVVLDEIQQTIDEETRFNLYVSESQNTLKLCVPFKISSRNIFVERLLAKKLPKIKKKKRF
ncbi:excinuclease ABC subunit C [Planococcus sp. 1R117A]|uniref:excinuclease ABC subunit C n=1 Tax=Planococcus sp. 1R117A TaxID=3447020 RepID=UPI003EDC5426